MKRSFLAHHPFLFRNVVRLMKQNTKNTIICSHTYKVRKRCKLYDLFSVLVESNKKNNNDQ